MAADDMAGERRSPPWLDWAIFSVAAISDQGPGLGLHRVRQGISGDLGHPDPHAGASEYLHAELAAFKRVSREARQRRGFSKMGSAAGLPQASIARHRDIIDAEIARADYFLRCSNPRPRAGSISRRSPSGRASGWTLEALMPFLLRDWTHTPELDGIKDRVGAALKDAFGDLPENRQFSRLRHGWIAGAVGAGIRTNHWIRSDAARAQGRARSARRERASIWPCRARSARPVMSRSAGG